MLKLYIILFLVLLVLVIFGYILSIINPIFLQVNTDNSTNTISSFITTTTFSFLDYSIFAIIIFAMFIDIIYSWFYPNTLKAIISIIGIFFLGYIALTIKLITIPIFTQLNANSILPFTYTLITSNYLLVIIFFALIVDTIFNLKKHDEIV